MKNKTFQSIHFQLIALLFVLVFFGCGSVKKKTEVEKVSVYKKDSIVSRVETIKSKPVHQNFIIKKICDTVTGRAKEFETKIAVGLDTVYLRSENNELNQSVVFNDTVQKQLIQGYELRISELESEIESNKLRTKPPVWSFYSVGVNILLLIIIFFLVKKYVSPPAWISRVFSS